MVVTTSGVLAAQEAPELTARWLRQARVAGAKLSTDMSASAIERDLAALAAQNVSVVEADSNFSEFLTERGVRSRAPLHAPVRPDARIGSGSRWSGMFPPSKS